MFSYLRQAPSLIMLLIYSYEGFKAKK
jgi:hypothetical protein